MFSAIIHILAVSIQMLALCPRKPGRRSRTKKKSSGGTTFLHREHYKIDVLWKEISKLREGLMSACGVYGTAGG